MQALKPSVEGQLILSRKRKYQQQIVRGAQCRRTHPPAESERLDSLDAENLRGKLIPNFVKLKGSPKDSSPLENE
jgi:hypothetical protein